VNKDVGLGPSVVLHLIQTIPENSFIYFDRYFSTVSLFEILHEQKIEGTATIISNPIKGTLSKRIKS
jgi:hypothetical protein